MANGAELLHEEMIEAGEMIVLQRGDDGPGERYGARHDRIGFKFRALKINFRKYVKRMLGKMSISCLEICFDERMVNFIEGMSELFAGTTVYGR